MSRPWEVQTQFCFMKLKIAHRQGKLENICDSPAGLVLGGHGKGQLFNHNTISCGTLIGKFIIPSILL